MEKEGYRKYHIIIPAFILVIQFIVIFCNLFKLQFSLIEIIQTLFDDSTYFINTLLLGYLIYILFYKKQLCFFKIGFVIFFTDFVIINKLYLNQTWNNLFFSIKQVIDKNNIKEWFLLIIIIIVSISLVSFIIYKNKNIKTKDNTAEKGQWKFDEDNHGLIRNSDAEQNSKSNIKVKSKSLTLPQNNSNDKFSQNYKWWFIIIFVFVLMLVVFLLFFAMKESILWEKESNLPIFFNIILFIALICIILVVAATAAKYICDLLLNMKRIDIKTLLDKSSGDNVLKTCLSLLLTPIIYQIGDYGIYTQNDLLEWLFSENIVPLFIAGLISFCISAVIIAVIFNLFNKGIWSNRIKSIAKLTLNRTINICEDLIKSIFRVIENCGPDFIDSLLYLFFDDCDEEDNNNNVNKKDTN